MQVTTVGLDLAKRIFQVHAVDVSGHVVVRKALRRAQVLPFFTKLPTCVIGIEACGTSHHWARELTGLGHEVRLMPPAYVKPYVKRGKNDAVDAEAICEAVTRPTMRFVAVKSAEQQAALSLHRTRNLLVKQRTQLVNMIRGLLAEFGIDIPEGLERALGLARRIARRKLCPGCRRPPWRSSASCAGRSSTPMLAFRPSTVRSWPCNGTMMSRDACRQSRASVRWVRRHWRLPSPIRGSSVQAASLPPGSG